MITAFLQIGLLGLLFAPGLWLAYRAPRLTFGLWLRCFAGCSLFFLALGLVFKAFPALLDLRFGWY